MQQKRSTTSTGRHSKHFVFPEGPTFSARPVLILLLLHLLSFFFFLHFPPPTLQSSRAANQADCQQMLQAFHAVIRKDVDENFTQHSL